MKSCLIVDDSKVIRKVARHILETMQFEVAEAADGKEALDHCTTETPDVILLDWNMPIMSGMDFLRAYPLDDRVSLGQSHFLHDRERHRAYSGSDRRWCRRICDETVRSRDARSKAANRRLHLSGA